MKEFRITINSLPDRENLVAEISQEAKDLIIRNFSKRPGNELITKS